MLNIRVDEAGTLHCAKCGGTSFTEKRTFSSKVVLGVGALLTSKKLKCQVCGTYNQTGNAQPFRGNSTAADNAIHEDGYVPTAEEAEAIVAEYDARPKMTEAAWAADTKAYRLRAKNARRARRSR